MPGRADMGRRPARPRDGHYSIEFEKRNDTFGTGCQFPDSGEPGGKRERPGMEGAAGRRKDSRWGPRVTSIWTHLEEALLLKLNREHEMATSESCESGESRPAPSA